MTTLLLAFIYMAFISLGLPDGLLGAAWPVMHGDIGAALPLAGIVSAIITVGTIVSSLLSDRLTRRFGAGCVTAVSVTATAAALIGFSCSSAFWQLCLWAVPYGLGAGAVDAALNNVVALYYRARHMSWLHCFWGIGASVGPYIMGMFLTNGNWSGGYHSVAAVQIGITAILFASLPLWKRLHVSDEKPSEKADEEPPLGTVGALKVRGVKAVLFAFFAYGAAEMIAMLWSSSYMHEYRGFDADTAAALASLFYLGMTVGRFFNGFLAERFSDKSLIRGGLLLSLVGVGVLLIPFSSVLAAGGGLLIVGLGCAPVYPCIIHATPVYFGRTRSQAIIGLEMAGAYAGSFLVPPLFGVLADHTTLGLFPVAIAAFALLSFGMMECVNFCRKKESN